MPKSLFPESFRLVLFLALALGSAARAQPQFFETVLLLEEPVVNVSSVDRVLYRWSTTRDFGMVTEFDLEDLTLELHSPSGIIYTDRIIVNGAVQPLSGIPRTLGGGFDIFWRFDLDNARLEQMTNVSKSNISASSGLHFDVHDSTSIPVDGRVSVKAYLDGVNQDPHTDQLEMQTTIPILFSGDFETGDFEGWNLSMP